MRLIDADKLIEEMSKWYWDKEKQKAAEEDISPMDLFTHLAITTIQKQPTVYDVNRIVEQLEETKDIYSELSLIFKDNTEIKKYIGMEQAIALALEIVKGGVVDD